MDYKQQRTSCKHDFFTWMTLTRKKRKENHQQHSTRRKRRGNKFYHSLSFNRRQVQLAEPLPRVLLLLLDDAFCACFIHRQHNPSWCLPRLRQLVVQQICCRFDQSHQPNFLHTFQILSNIAFIVLFLHISISVLQGKKSWLRNSYQFGDTIGDGNCSFSSDSGVRMADVATEPMEQGKRSHWFNHG